MKNAEFLSKGNSNLGKKLKKIMSTNEAYEILDSNPATIGSTWSAGGCAVLAYALHKILPGSQLLDILNTQTNKTEHVAVAYQNRVYDASGSFSMANFVDQFKQREIVSADLKSVPHSAKRAKLSDIPIEPDLIAVTRDYLAQQL